MLVTTEHWVSLPLLISGIEVTQAEDLRVRVTAHYEPAARRPWSAPTIAGSGTDATVEIAGLEICGVDPERPSNGWVWREIAPSDPWYGLIAKTIADEDIIEKAEMPCIRHAAE